MLAKSSVQIARRSGHSSSSKACLFYSTVCTTVFDACTNVTFSFYIFVIYHQSIDTNHQVYKLQGLQSLFYSTVCTKVFLMLVQMYLWEIFACLLSIINQLIRIIKCTNCKEMRTFSLYKFVQMCKYMFFGQPGVTLHRYIC